MTIVDRPDAVYSFHSLHWFSLVSRDSLAQSLAVPDLSGNPGNTRTQPAFDCSSHKPTSGNGLGMTGNYIHARPETQRQQIGQALRGWPASLAYALERRGEERPER
jgi:hypothetical protein